MKKALEILKHYTSYLTNEGAYVKTVGVRQNYMDEAIAELEEAMKPKTCDGCKWEQETKLITTKVGDKVDICKLCTRYENLQDHYEPKANT